MRKACLVIPAPYNNGRVFERGNTDLNRDDCLKFYFDLQDIFKGKNIDLNTHDINLPGACDFIIYNEMPKNLPGSSDVGKSILLLFECAVIKPENWVLSKHNHFSKIFTWDDRFVDGEKYFKMNFAHSNSISEFLSFKEKTKFCTLIASNKVITHELELYSRRLEAIRWFENNHPDQLEFYGFGWDLLTFDESKLTRRLNRVSFLKGLRRLLKSEHPSYKGIVAQKAHVLRQYKFSICYENAQEIPGYITEKIFDSMCAGCIPIYWGAPNISDYIPDRCFINRLDFNTYEDLYQYLNEMSQEEYDSRLESIKSFLKSAGNIAFTPFYNAHAIANYLT
ncbi:MAG: hypothetical protein ACI8Q1_000566 [Parvicella sp.]|jgi:hypothetical protein